MNVNHNPKLTSAEYATLWNTYIADSLAISVLKHFLATNETPEITTILEYSISISETHLKEVTKIFNEEQIPLPIGFGEQDLNSNAAKLWSDTFYLRYIEYMAKAGLGVYALSMALATRKDIRSFYQSCLEQTTQLFNMFTDTALEKGVYVRTPFMTYNESSEFIEDTSFLGNYFEGKRALLAMEISHLGRNIEVNNVGKTLLLGFSQVTKSPKIQHYFLNGLAISKKHVQVFLELLQENDSSYPSTWDGEITNSIEAPFSERLMLFHTTMLGSVGMTNYGAALSTSMRKDIGTAFMRLLLETAELADDGAKLLIKHGWLEKPPQSINRQELRDKK
ncbi:DUF3231 family protein [Anaerobacillus alkaliphilus]|uniref:DUF3231 family protein n=1 Tax=Anaerobacillus alkaliphilus TaxID=1548597 RepID=A0A4Q0VWF4_9BACI|nr:DUF3231 family protein [Anaerobacillus alkaliphilus]RXJ04047.1 DUF3231 family protein [Anaerobacillus alkaliphilus]